MNKSLAQRIAQGLADAYELEGIAPDEIVAVKSDSDLTHRRFYVEKASGVDTDKRRVSGVVMSTETTDRMGDVIKVSGWKLDDFKANPQLLWAHDSHSLPIGTPTKVRKGRTLKGLRALMSDEEYHSADENPHAELVFRLVAKGALPGRSVGFRGLDVYRPADDIEREKLKLGRYGVLYKEADLLENSVVPIPANQLALQEKALGCARDVYDTGCDDLPSEVVKSVFEGLAFTEQDAERIARSIRRRSVIVPDLSGIAKSLTEGVDIEKLEDGEASEILEAVDALDEISPRTEPATKADDVEEPEPEPDGAKLLADYRAAAAALDEHLAKAGLSRADLSDAPPEDLARVVSKALDDFGSAVKALGDNARAANEEVADAIDQLKDHLTETAVVERESADDADPVGEAAIPDLAGLADAIKIALARPAPQRTADTEKP